MVQIGTTAVGPGRPCFFIAEIGINHNGSLDMALQLIEEAAKAGAGLVKLQKRTVDVVYTAEELAQERTFDPSFIAHARARTALGSNEVLPAANWKRLDETPEKTTNGDLKYALEFGTREFDTIDRRCVELGIGWSASSWDGLSVNFIDGMVGVACHKIASACLTHTDLLKRVRAHGKSVILSTGGSTIEQVQKAVEILGQENLVILHCTATYPSEDDEINLRVIETLARMYPSIPIGYSGHEPDTMPSLMAVAHGACVIERHITLDRTLPGSDQKASIEPQEFMQLVDSVRRYERLRGDGVKRVLPREVPIMAKLRRIKDF